MTTNPFAVSHRLHTVSIRLELIGHPEITAISALAQGHAVSKRTALWTESAMWTNQDEDLRQVPADWVNWVTRTALQDRPNSPERLAFGLAGGLGIQDPLWPE